MSNHSTIPIPEERLSGILADLALCGTYSEGIGPLTQPAMTSGDLHHDRSGYTADFDRALYFSGQMPSGARQFNCKVWRLRENDHRQWAQKILSLHVRWLRSEEAGDVSRPLLTPAEVDDLLTSPSGVSESLESLYANADFPDVSKFVIDNPYLATLLKEAHGALRKIFPENRLRLEHRIDPEVPEDEKLFVWVETRASVEDALAQLDDFEDRWWLDNLEKAHGKLLIDVEFV